MGLQSHVVLIWLLRGMTTSQVFWEIKDNVESKIGIWSNFFIILSIFARTEPAELEGQ